MLNLDLRGFNAQKVPFGKGTKESVPQERASLAQTEPPTSFGKGALTAPEPGREEVIPKRSRTFWKEKAPPPGGAPKSQL